MSQPSQTNREFARSHEFMQACRASGVEATKRQASKYRMGRGWARNGKPRCPDSDTPHGGTGGLVRYDDGSVRCLFHADDEAA